ncbi:lycopene cyclase domain-containing protein [Sinomonas notoginsengisoli]|uniref:lycopene cyclase domain-containing protein n=1 Tax=Sinomonas notoginsengisoli TaxID=1457311 RepID=UPI001F19F71A|nr:lycopene cyclase domain-containing protein [Sinomonas notoginsengisoli]
MAYLIALLVSASGVAVLDARFRLAFGRDPRAAALTVAAGTAFFLAWDAAAIAAGIFEHRASPLTTGLMLGPEMPVEEPVFLAFFSYTALVLYSGARRVLVRRPATRAAKESA